LADIQLTDDLGKSAPDVKIDLTDPSSLLKYAKGEILHLVVAPDFLERATQPLQAAAPNPISFQLRLQHGFQLGNTKPEIDLTPSFQASIRANTTAGSNLFDQDPFRVPATVPPQIGYVSLALQGLLDLGVSGSSGDLTFGFDANETIGFEYWKAFGLGNSEPTLGAATGQTLSSFVIPADIADLQQLGLNDVCTVSGTGSLKVSGGFKISVAPNPLASVDLPLNAGKVQVQAGVMAGVNASFTIAGAYQVRALRTSAEAIELSVYKKQGTTLTTALSVSGGASVNVGNTDLLKSLLGAISTDPNDDATTKLFADDGLSKEEIATLTSAIKESLDHSLQASIDAALSQLTDDQAAFQYEIRPALLDPSASAAVHRALEGDFSLLTALETGDVGGAIAPGIRLIASVLTGARKTQTTLTVNLFGLVNVLSLSDLVRQCVVVKDPGTGYLTISDSATGDRINAVVDPLRRSEALRKAMFESLMLTATYRVSTTIQMTGLAGHNFHFALNDSTNRADLADYLNWLVVLNLLAAPERDTYLQQFPGGGPSTCLLRTEFDDEAWQSLFFKAPGQPWERDHYLEMGRQAMRALIDPRSSDTDRYRYDLLDQHWKDALATGPNDDLATLLGLHVTDPNGLRITQYLRGDVYTIVWWATAMQSAGAAIIQMQQFLAGAPPATLADNHEFAQRRAQLQSTMAGLMKQSQARFSEPWGLVALYWAAGSTSASAKLVARGLLVQRPEPSVAAAK
jgi:hypothetical protein